MGDENSYIIVKARIPEDACKPYAIIGESSFDDSKYILISPAPRDLECKNYLRNTALSLDEVVREVDILINRSQRDIEFHLRAAQTESEKMSVYKMLQEFLRASE